MWDEIVADAMSDVLYSVYSQLVPKVNSYPSYLVPTVKSYLSHVVPKVNSYPSTKET